MRMHVLRWNLYHGRSVPPCGRDLLARYAAALAGWAWDVALLQEVPPWWPPELARAAGGHDVDHVFAGGLVPAGTAEVLERGPLSDHAPVRVALAAP